jgi:hypothetical protein
MAGKPGGKKTLGRSRRRWKDKIKRNLKQKGWEDVYWTCTSEEGQALMTIVMKVHRP